MASMSSEPREQSGKLVAFEGDVDILATQLRLLPPSQKILVLPSLHLLDDDIEQPFKARAFIRNAHTAFVERTKGARSFLRSSTATQPRLVFTNGGSIGARTLCIKKICENITNGDLGEAEIIFNDIIKDGVAGLMKGEDIAEEELASNGNEENDAVVGEKDTPENVEDPSSKAMKAADCLDRETAELQEDTVQDLTLKTKEPSTDAALEARAEGPIVEEYPCIAESQDDIITTVVTVPSKAQRLPSQMCFSSLGVPAPASPISPFTATSDYTIARSQQTETDDDNDFEGDEYAPSMASPYHDSLNSVPPTATTAVVYGEARVVALQSAPPKTTRKVKSVDGFHSNTPAYAHWNSSPRDIKHTTSAYHLGHLHSSIGKVAKCQQLYDGYHTTVPRSTFLKASPTIIKKLSISDAISSSVSTPDVRVYVDRRTDYKDLPTEEEPEEHTPFEPVFPVIEDLVIHFTHEPPHEVLEYVLSTYKSGNYPVFPSNEQESSSVPASSTSVDAEDPIVRPTSYNTTETDDDGFQRRHEFDPYAANSYTGGINQWLMKQPQKEISARHLSPPSPSLTPPPSAGDIPGKFCEFSSTDSNSIIGIQNSLRSFLDMHFPAGENGYTQCCFPVSPETERLWKPVFGNDESPSNEGRNVDQIIALGCEEGVTKEFFAQVSGQIERLGMKRDGLTRSSKIDLRYFIANVMQTHSNLPLNTQSTFDPLASPEILAACIVPQIEAFLALNTSIRLLILHYSFNHLATMIALRKILGQDVLKIAGIMDSMSSDPPSKANPTFSESTSQRPSLANARYRKSSQVSQRKASINSNRSTSTISFSKANYLLPSAATDDEISTFLSGICTSLVKSSTFYTPEPEPKPKPAISKKPPPAMTLAPSTLNPRDSSCRQNTRTDSKIARLTGSSPPRTPTIGKNHRYAASFASTMRTTVTERFRREEAKNERDWENFYIGEEDSEDDDYDRMVMGRAMAKIVPEVKLFTSDGKAPKRSTKKALKWLGLA